MERVINSKLTYYAIISVAIFVIWTIIYCSIGVDNWQWQAFDKINDRLFACNLLFITSFIFRDVVYRLFSYIGIGYIIMYAFYEFTYIMQIGIYGMSSMIASYFINISLLYLSLGAVILFIVAYVSKGNSK